MRIRENRGTPVTNKFLAVLAFTRVAETGSFTIASKKLGVSVSTMTKCVAKLEDELGVQLFNRTTRRLALTDCGRTFYDRCVGVLAGLSEAEALVREASAAPRGQVRLCVPVSFGRVTLVPALPEFYAQYPHISLDLSFRDTTPDLVGGGFDIGVQIGEMSDSAMITRMLTRGPQMTVAAPSYIARCGRPQIPADLKRHNCIPGRFGPEWTFRDPSGRPIGVRIKGNLLVDSGDALREAAVAGVGIAQSTWWLFRKDLEAGAVVPLLEEYAAEGVPISIVYAANRHMPANVRAVIDFLVAITQAERPGPKLQIVYAERRGGPQLATSAGRRVSQSRK
jgi:DNA-binding transcriptional LysR family regulator